MSSPQLEHSNCEVLVSLGSAMTALFSAFAPSWCCDSGATLLLWMEQLPARFFISPSPAILLKRDADTLYVCMYVCMYACMYVCIYVWKDGWMDGWMDVFMYIYACIH